MGKAHNPRRGSMQFWPRRKSRHSFVRIRSWVENKLGSKGAASSNVAGFVGYKAGMTHALVIDNRAKSTTKGEKLSVPVTIIECPKILALGAVFYKNIERDGIRKVGTVYAKEVSKDWKKVIGRKSKTILPTKVSANNSFEKFESGENFDKLRLIIVSNPKVTTTSAKKPQLMEVAVLGSKEDQIAFVKEKLGKELAVNEVFSAGQIIDTHSINKGKGFQGVVKRYGVPLVSHKSEKGQRKIGAMGAWTPKRVDYRIPQPGGMGGNLRTAYNKQILKIGSSEEVDAVNRVGGIAHFGEVRNSYLLIKGSVPGNKKAAIMLTCAIRANKYKNKSFAANLEIKYISKRDKSQF